MLTLLIKQIAAEDFRRLCNVIWQFHRSIQSDGQAFRAWLRSNRAV
jgi:hypothetical protein